MFNKNIRPWVYGVLLATGTVFLFLGGPDYYSTRSFRNSWDLGHIAYFALLSVLLSRWRFVIQRPLAGQWIIILSFTLLVGVSVEFAQYSVARTPDTGDIFRDLTGSLLVLVFGSFRSKLRPARWRHSLQVAVLVLLLGQLWPLTRSLADEALARHQFPLLSGFETPFEIDRWADGARLSVETMPAISNGRFLKVSLTTDQYSGTALNYFDGNWAPFRTLKISLYNPGEAALQITCRIHDLQHADGYEEHEDRFNRKFLLIPGWNHIEIDLNEVEESPASRSMDMSRIRGLGLFVVSLPAPRKLYLDNVRLFP